MMRGSELSRAGAMEKIIFCLLGKKRKISYPRESQLIRVFFIFS